MKKLLAFSLLSSSIFLSANSAKADWDHWGIKFENQQTGQNLSGDGYSFYKVDSLSGTETFVTNKCHQYTYGASNDRQNGCRSDEEIRLDQETGYLYLTEQNGSNNESTHIYNPFTDTWTQDTSTPWDNSYTKTLERKAITSNGNGGFIIEMDGKKMLEKKANGELHIGENSWITKEEDGKQKVWAKDANGNPIPIDYTNGTKLLINGRDVEQSINNVGALSAALTGLPTVPTDTTLACGLGTGTHGGDFAFSGGCASKVNKKLSINYAASMTMPGQDYAGDFEDTFSARAGFVWQLGKSTKSSQISMKDKDELKQEISDLKANNKNIISQNKALLARLERLEKVALNSSKSQDLATIKLP